MNRPLSEDFEGFAQYRKLRAWCLESGEKTQVAQCDGRGPFKKISREVEDDEFTKITVECALSTQAMEITVDYKATRLDGEPTVVSNPVVMVMEDGRVIRTHGDFNRILRWLNTLEAGKGLPNAPQVKGPK